MLPTFRSHPFDPPDDLGPLRDEQPLRRLRYPDGHLGWLVTSHALARSVLADPRFSARSEHKRVPVPRPGAASFIGQPAKPGWFVDMDPPDHTTFRRLVAGQFTVRRMAQLRTRIEEIVDHHLDLMEASGPPVDLVSSFALPVPSLVICELLGVPYEDREEFHRNSAVLFSLEATAEEGRRAAQALTDFLLDLVRRKRAHPLDDVLSGLATTSDLTDQQLAGTGVLLLTAGHETLAHMLALGTFTLLSHPDELARLLADHSMIDKAVEELLRYLTIFHFGVPRAPLEDVELDGRLVRAGECVTISLSAADRDPQHFAEPDRLDLTRSTTGHLAFGHGIHQCIGQHLARLEMQVGYWALFQRFPRLRLAVAPADVPMSADTGRYGVRRLPVAW